MSNLAGEAAALRRWLFDVALPLWWDVGADHGRGGFHEAIDLDGSAVAAPHRARTITRQVFSYCEAGRLGWNGPWRAAASHALDFFAKHFVTADGSVVSVVDLDGKVVDATFDLYDQAFALLAFASGHRAFGEFDAMASSRRGVADDARTNVAHAQGGFPRGSRRPAAATRESSHAFVRGGAGVDGARRRSGVAGDGGRHRGALPRQVHRSVDRGTAGVFRRGLVTGTGSRKAGSASPATITNGHSCSTAGQSSPAAKGRRPWRGSSNSPTRTGSMPSAGSRSMPCSVTAPFTIRSPGFGRRLSAFAPI